MPETKFQDYVPVIWKWVLTGNSGNGDNSDSDSDGYDNDTPTVVNDGDVDHRDTDNDDHDDASSDHDDTSSDHDDEVCSVNFKCLGSTRQVAHQDALQAARDALLTRQPLHVRLEFEPENEIDANAICFEVCIDGNWKRIGYVARELTQYVRQAIDSGKIISVSAQWIRYRYWPNSGFGFYAAVTVTKRGRWHYEVYRKSSY